MLSDISSYPKLTLSIAAQLSYVVHSYVLFKLTINSTHQGPIQGPLVSANLVEIATEFNRSDGAIARALGSALVLALAFATVTWSVISVKFGKRPVFLVCTVMMLAGSLLAGFSKR